MVNVIEFDSMYSCSTHDRASNNPTNMTDATLRREIEIAAIRAKLELLDQVFESSKEIQQQYQKESESHEIESLYARGVIGAYEGRRQHYTRIKEQLKDKLIELLSE